MSTCAKCGTHLRNVDGVCPTCMARSISSFLRTSHPADEQTEVQGYQLHEVIGRGGMGIVYRATRVADGLIVAVKLLPAHLTDNEDITDRFAREAHALAAFDHEHVLRVLDSGITLEGRLFLVTEFAAGGDLAKLLQQGAPPLPEALRLYNEVLAAIIEAHRQGIAHRDIKPANILLDAQGRVRVGDFSLAKLLHDGAAPQLTMTQSADVFGTPYYIAPEVRRGAGSVDERADIFSLGVLLHELLTGRLPIGNYEPASSIVPVPREVDRIIADCLREDPAKRPGSVAELQTALCRAVSPPTVWRNTAIVLVVALLVLIAWGRWNQLHRASTQRSSLLAASAEKPWINSLGMEFVPVPGTGVLFAVWETRRKDYGAYAETEFASTKSDLWRRPLSPVTPEHPVTPVSVVQAMRFCSWLTERERSEHLLPDGASYRLPTNAEWDRAAGIADAASHTTKYAWGDAWPPLNASLFGNFAGKESRADGLGYTDAWPFTAPAGSCRANAFGLFDLSGNVAEWCVAPFDQKSNDSALRGGSWEDASADSLRLDHHERQPPNLAVPHSGFRVVIEFAR